ncbi:MAG: hypothetical protein IM653_03160 [Phenylobacterium sp.]|uniref:hypothetical protein n=1 Tax=Phenylobacterium sp. TaxID=1871053 RepID=UPI0025FC4E2B|nr:hypothetical protein [Phenylobacterium sp.]MCA6223578.1 hypothetical protein [Phenylobacterium sp.]MCA6227624.1 hypothetical protein [Phenylobacterium sp.]MCA6232810.1 hypothetical protein [Phenylobacterium sp.]MCA6234114.1 hypothetical protein [Phenylobacterium sp.]MCA6248637.1 hypothetical protein [Phenylobacterium sp.]
MLTKILAKALIPFAALSTLGATRVCAEPAAPRLATGRNLYALVLERDLPGFAPRPIVISRFKAVLPKYGDVPGLRAKFFVVSDRKTYGGVYLWTDKAAADAYLGSPLLAEISAGAAGERTVTRFEIPLAIDGPAAGTTDLGKGDAVIRIVRITPPAGTPRSALLAGFEQSVPTYADAPGLVHKWFSIAEDGRFGGVYIFADKARADAWFSPAWWARVRATYGAAADVLSFDAPVVIEN